MYILHFYKISTERFMIYYIIILKHYPIINVYIFRDMRRFMTILRNFILDTSTEESKIVGINQYVLCPVQS